MRIKIDARIRNPVKRKEKPNNSKETPAKKRKLIADGAIDATKRINSNNSKQTPTTIEKQSIPDLLVSVAELLKLPIDQQQQKIFNFQEIMAALEKQKDYFSYDLFFSNSKNKKANFFKTRVSYSNKKLDALIKKLDLYIKNGLGSKDKKCTAENIVGKIAVLFYNAYMDINNADSEHKKSNQATAFLTLAAYFYRILEGIGPQKKIPQVEKSHLMPTCELLASLSATYFANMFIEKQVSDSSKQLLESLEQKNTFAYKKHFHVFKTAFTIDVLCEKLKFILDGVGKHLKDCPNFFVAYKNACEEYMQRMQGDFFPYEILHVLLWNIAIEEALTSANKLILLEDAKKLWEKRYKFIPSPRDPKETQRHEEGLDSINSVITQTQSANNFFQVPSPSPN